MTLVLSYYPVDLDAVALVRFHCLNAMIPVQFCRLVGMYAVLFRHLVDAYIVIPVPFHPFADMDAVAPVLFHLCPVVAVAEDTPMTSKTYIYGVNYCVSYAMITVVSQRKSQLMSKYAKTRHYLF